MQEHMIYPQAIRWIAEKRISINEEKVHLDKAIQSDSTMINPIG